MNNNKKLLKKYKKDGCFVYSNFYTEQPSPIKVYMNRLNNDIRHPYDAMCGFKEIYIDSRVDNFKEWLKKENDIIKNRECFLDIIMVHNAIFDDNGKFIGFATRTGPFFKILNKITKYY